MASGNFNIKNPAIKRIHADVRELQRDPSDQYCAAPLEDNLFEWHFTIRGPESTDFEGGIYHGRILLPADYPFKPPNIILLTPNGRFEVGTKICLSISAHHPEYWQPAWGVRLILEALISFLPTEGNGAIAALDWTPEERKRLAQQSQEWRCSKCGLAKKLLPELQEHSIPKDNKYLEQIAQMHLHGLPEDLPKKASQSQITGQSETPVNESKEIDSSLQDHQSKAQEPTQGNETTPGEHLDIAKSALEETKDSGSVNHAQSPTKSDSAQTLHTQENAKEEDDKLIFVIYALVFAILALILRKVLKAFHYL